MFGAHSRALMTAQRHVLSAEQARCALNRVTAWQALWCGGTATLQTQHDASSQQGLPSDSLRSSADHT